MPTRATLALLATIVGLFLVFNFKTPDVATTRPQVVLPAGSKPPAAAAPNGPSAAAPDSAGGTPSPAPAPSGWRDGSYTGQDFPNRYGDVQVVVKIAGGRITDVQAPQLPSDRRRSQEINDQAAPLLHDEVLQAQSAQIDSISGATYTSDSYGQSLQSALDQAHR